MKILLAVFFCLIFLSGCARPYITTNKFTLDPRGPNQLMMSVTTEHTSGTLTYNGPTPFFGEPLASIVATSSSITITLGMDTDNAKTFWGKVSDNIKTVITVLIGYMIGSGTAPVAPA